MAAPIRPNFTPVSPQLQNPAQARSAAQRAFFEAALGKAQGQAAQPQPQASAQGSGQTTRAAQTQSTQAASPTAARPAYVPKMPATLPAEPPTRILRPGSILDIKV